MVVCRALDRRAGAARGFCGSVVVRQALQLLADDEAPLRERFEARNELYRRMIAAGIVE